MTDIHPYYQKNPPPELEKKMLELNKKAIECRLRQIETYSYFVNPFK